MVKYPLSSDFGGIWAGDEEEEEQRGEREKKRGEVVTRCWFTFICLINSWLIRGGQILSLSLWATPGEESRAWWLIPGGLGWIFLGKREPSQGKLHIPSGQGRPGRVCVLWCHLGCDTWVLCPLVSLGVSGTWDFGVQSCWEVPKPTLGTQENSPVFKGKLKSVTLWNLFLVFDFTLKSLWCQRCHQGFARFSIN